jgi:hypothetical protein
LLFPDASRRQQRPAKKGKMMNSQLLFADYFGIDQKVMDDYGALNICLEADLPLFIDPFLLFSSDNEEYRKLHDKIVGHLINSTFGVPFAFQNTINMLK